MQTFTQSWEEGQSFQTVTETWQETETAQTASYTITQTVTKAVSQLWQGQASDGEEQGGEEDEWFTLLRRSPSPPLVPSFESVKLPGICPAVYPLLYS